MPLLFSATALSIAFMVRFPTIFSMHGRGIVGALDRFLLHGGFLFSLMDRFNCDENCREVLVISAGPMALSALGAARLTFPMGASTTAVHYQFTVTSGTTMHDSHLPLRKCAAIYLMCESKKGGQPTKRTLGVTYRLAPLPPHP